MKWIRNPSFQFFILLVGAPVIAITGASTGSILAERLAWSISLGLISLAGLRSYRHERARLPQENLWRQVGGAHSALVRYLVGVITLSLLLGLGAVGFGVAFLLELVI